MNGPIAASGRKRRTSARGRLRQLIVAAGSCAALFLATFEAFDSWRQHGVVITAAEERVDNLADILAEHMRRTVAAVDASLTQIAVAASRIGPAEENRDDWEAILSGAFAGMVDAGSLNVIDPRGIIRHSTMSGLVGVSREDRYVVSVLPQSVGLVADSPLLSPNTGETLIPLGRRIDDPDGRYIGAVVATLRLKPLGDFYGTVNIGQQGVIRVLHPEGHILLRRPYVADAAALPTSDDAVWRAWRANYPRGLLSETNPVGGHALITAFRTMANPSLAIAVSLDRDEILEDWRREVIIDGSIAAGMILLLLVATVGALRLIDAQTATEARILRRDRQLRLAQSIANMGAITYEAADGSVAVSPEVGTILGWAEPRDSISLDGFLAPVVDDDRPRVRAAIERCAREGTSYQVEFQIDRPDGERRDIWSEGFRDAEGRGRAVEVVGICQDVTARRASERLIRQTQRMDAVGQLTGGVAHDFNNLLTVIIGNVDLLAEMNMGNERARNMAEAVRRAAERGAELTRNLLAFARKQALRPVVVDLNAIVAETDQLLRSTLGEDIELDTRLAPQLWNVLIDASQLQTALVNLAVNARDAMPRGGKLTIETGNIVLDEHYARANADARPGRYAMMAVSDTGTGIPAHLLERVFEPFFTTKDVGEGTGLGLSMVYGFTKQSGGHIKIYSEIDLGTTVRLYLPQADAAATGEAVSQQNETIPAGNETILVVEDDAMVRDFVVAQLGTLGYRTLVAANAAEALALVDRGDSIDLLFTDVVLTGGMNGKQLAEEIARRRPGIKVLFTSGYTENAIVHRGQLDPGVLLLSKPYRLPTLAQMVRTAFGRKNIC